MATTVFLADPLNRPASERERAVAERAVRCLEAIVLDPRETEHLTVEDLAWVAQALAYVEGSDAADRARDRLASLLDARPVEPTAAGAAIVAYARTQAGHDPATDAAIRTGVEAIARSLPPRGEAPDAKAVLFGTLLMFQASGPPWRAWAPVLADAVIKTQAEDGAWAPTVVGVAPEGPVVSMAMLALVAEVYYRYYGFPPYRKR